MYQGHRRSGPLRRLGTALAASTISNLSCGTVLCRAEAVAELSPDWFDRDRWQESGARIHTSTGRASVMIGKLNSETWVLRHYCRGGFVARFIDDHYWWLGLERTRAFLEWRLLDKLTNWGLPAPEPIAACVRRTGLVYQADIITKYLPDTRTLSSYLREEGVRDETWTRIGRMVRQFHDRDVCHPDLTAHNILLSSAGEPYLVDFDNARIRADGHWKRRGVARLQRSLRKVALETGVSFDPDAWEIVVSAYYGRDESAD